MLKHAFFALALLSSNAFAAPPAPHGHFYLGAGVGVSDHKQVHAQDTPDPRVVYDLTAGYTFHRAPISLELGYQRVGFDSNTYFTSDSVSFGPVLRSPKLGQSPVNLFVKTAAVYTETNAQFRSEPSSTHHAWRAVYALVAEMPASVVFPDAPQRYSLRLTYNHIPAHKHVGTDQSVGVQLLGKF